MANIINQAFGNNWASYNADCNFGMSNLPSGCIDFTVYSPPFAQLYIYSDSVADMGNSSDEDEFFEGYEFTLKELHRVTKENGYQAIHCKDLMRYMNSHGYSGQDDFPGKIIRLAERCGWTFQRWITIWKNPVVEMQRTKTYGLLHKSFQERAEVVRQGAPDVVLVLRKQKHSGEYYSDVHMPELPESVKDRIKAIWTMLGEGNNALAIHNMPLGAYNPQFIDVLSKKIKPGRLCFVRCMPLPRYHEGKVVGYFDMMGEVIQRFENQGSWKFHTRIALTDGTYLVGFRNWTSELKKNYKELNGQVKHNLRGPGNAEVLFTTKHRKYIHGTGIDEEGTAWDFGYQEDENGLWYIEVEESTIYQDGNKDNHQDYIGNDPPENWHDNGYYSILVWQRYASPVWSDLDGLPKSHPDAWMDIDQTNVLNFKAAKDPEDQKHICPLQLDLSERLILEYSRPGEIVLSPFGGISSEGYTAIKLDRKAILFELKPSYWRQGTKYLTEVEKTNQQVEMKLEIV